MMHPHRFRFATVVGLLGLATLAAASLVMPGVAPAASHYTYRRIDPYRTIEVQVGGVNASGLVAGVYLIGRHQHGFVTGPGGRGVTRLDLSAGRVLRVAGLNDRGQVIGSLTTDPPGINPGSDTSFGFLTGPHGKGVTALRPLGATEVVPAGVNNAGQVAIFCDDSLGFLTGANGVGGTQIRPFGSEKVSVAGVNAAGQVAGLFGDSAGNYTFGFLTGPNGKGAMKVDPFGSVSMAVAGVNASGQVAGTYNAGGGTYGFVTGPGGVGATKIDPFGSRNVAVAGLNDVGQVVGTYTVGDHANRAFVTGPNGLGAARLRPPGATDVSIAGINNRGQVAGSYNGAIGCPIGFLATPVP